MWYRKLLASLKMFIKLNYLYLGGNPCISMHFSISCTAVIKIIIGAKNTSVLNIQHLPYTWNIKRKKLKTWTNLDKKIQFPENKIDKSSKLHYDWKTIFVITCFFLTTALFFIVSLYVIIKLIYPGGRKSRDVVYDLKAWFLCLLN